MPDLFPPSQDIADYLQNNGYELLEVAEQHITVNCNVGGRVVKVRGEFGSRFPLDLPKFYLLDRLQYGLLGHVNWRKKPERSQDDIGLICPGIDISRSVNYESPELVFEYGLELAVNLLSRIFSSDEHNRREVLAEFSGHWQYHCKNTTAKHVIFVESDSPPTVITVYNQRKNLFNYWPKDPLVNDDYGLKPIKNDKPDGKGIFIPLDAPVLPPEPQESPLCWWHNSVLPTLSEETCIFLEQRCRSHINKTRPYTIIFKVPLGMGKSAWAGLSLTHNTKLSTKRKKPPPLFPNASRLGWSAEPFSVQIHNQSYLLPRGGADNELSSEKILIVGCGSLGGEVARQLAYAGIGQLDLLEYDSFETNNIYRHVLPSKYIGLDKAIGLKRRLEDQFPYLIVEKVIPFKELKNLSEYSNLEEFLSQYDGVILATGDVTQERHFNKVVYGLDKKPWMIFSWLEGYGVGGHAVLVYPESRGCLSCLFRDPDSGEVALSNIQNFLSVNQEFAVDISGCGTHFLPYGYIDVVETATLTTRLIEDLYRGSIQSSVRVSWKGAGQEAEAAGLKMTGRWKRFKKNRQRILLEWSVCPVCGVADDL